jgi:hypothetical protein
MPTVLDVQPLGRLLAALTPGEPLVHDTLTVVPLLRPSAPDPGWLTLAEAGEAITIAEVDEAGAVPTLKVVNGAARPLLLLDGEELVGARQNRVLNTSVLVAAGSTLTIPVSCVEEGRWGYRTRRFVSGDVSLFASARRKKTARVTASLRARAGHRADQDEVWSDVAAMAAAYKVASPTGAMHDLYDQHAQELARAREALSPLPDQVGALVFVGEDWMGLEVLPCARLFASGWARLGAGYAVEAIGREPMPGRGVSPAELLRRLASTAVEPAPAVGLGVEYRLDGNAVGAALVVDEDVAHLEAFPA